MYVSYIVCDIRRGGTRGYTGTERGYTGTTEPRGHYGSRYTGTESRQRPYTSSSEYGRGASAEYGRGGTSTEYGRGTSAEYGARGQTQAPRTTTAY